MKLTKYIFIILAIVALGASSCKKENPITKNSVTADFSYTISSKTVFFTNLSTNAIDYDWSFGDGQTSASSNPTHAYSASGTYTVTLTATALLGGTSTKFKSVVIP